MLNPFPTSIERANPLNHMLRLMDRLSKSHDAEDSQSNPDIHRNGHQGKEKVHPQRMHRGKGNVELKVHWTHALHSPTSIDAEMRKC